MVEPTRPSGNERTTGDGGVPACGILLVNLGSPAAPTAPALRRYLAEFLWDHRVVEAPRALWWLVLHGIILRTRPAHSARLYARVWTPEGAPLLAIARRQAAALGRELARRLGASPPLALGMRYGAPSIAQGLEQLRRAGADRVLVLPLYPQYSGPTTGSAFDAVADALKAWRVVPELHFIADYHQSPAYIAALAASVRERWAADGPPDRLLFSFHGLPLRYARAGDPYEGQCRKTARAVASVLNLADDQWRVAFQSRFGREPWLEPYTDQTLAEWGAAGLGRVDVLCPGFAADCLETLEEIALRGRETFLAAGGRELRYLPALNDRPDHIAALAEIILKQISESPVQCRSNSNPL